MRINGRQFSSSNRRQKDTDARWTNKNNKAFFGYKNHIQIDVANKRIRDFDVMPAWQHDSHVFEELLDKDDSSRDVYADSVYRSQETLEFLEEQGYREHIQRKGYRDHPCRSDTNRGT
jgi:IS5 family transposase